MLKYCSVSICCDKFDSKIYLFVLLNLVSDILFSKLDNKSSKKFLTSFLTKLV